MKKWTYLVGILALGFVIFNNIVQTIEVIRENQNYMMGLVLGLISSVLYGILNIRN